MKKNVSLLVINGPNLNLLGKREKGIYGNFTLDELKAKIKAYAWEKSIRTEFFQSNSEGEIVDLLHTADSEFDGIILNAAAYTHTSVAIRDAIAGIDTPVVEVHLSNVYKREEFRHKSFISPVCRGTIAGFGPLSYCLAVEFFSNTL